MDEVHSKIVLDTCANKNVMDARAWKFICARAKIAMDARAPIFMYARAKKCDE